MFSAIWEQAKNHAQAAAGAAGLQTLQKWSTIVYTLPDQRFARLLLAGARKLTASRKLCAG
jgi:hypothetical protein